MAAKRLRNSMLDQKKERNNFWFGRIQQSLAGGRGRRGRGVETTHRYRNRNRKRGVAKKNKQPKPTSACATDADGWNAAADWPPLGAASDQSAIASRRRPFRGREQKQTNKTSQRETQTQTQKQENDWPGIRKKGAGPGCGGRGHRRGTSSLTTRRAKRKQEQCATRISQ